MLFILTGEIQTGKTRWLLRQVEDLEAHGVQACGVVAPGTWVDHGEDAPERYEKTGIDNLMLPQRVIVPFARRDDLAQAAGEFDENSQAARARLRWAIDDGAIAQVNEHFADLARIDKPGNRLLVVDEFGLLELVRGEGLTNAVALIDRGATPVFPHALIVVRAGLLETARERFANAPWGGIQEIRDIEQGRLLDLISK